MSLILVVEDNLFNQKMITKRLAFHGYDVCAVDDGVEALSYLERQHPNLILMDMMMPHLDGWQTTQLIKTLPHVHSIPIIAVTACAMREDKARCFAAGCDGYVEKPIVVPNLLSMIEQLLQQSVEKQHVRDNSAFNSSLSVPG